MKTLIAERPVAMAILLGAAALAFLYAWLQTGKRPALELGLGFLALIPIAWIISVRWVTDREQIRAAIYSTAEAVRDNDLDRAIQIIEPGQRALIESAVADLSRFTFTEARINRLRSIEMIDGSDPPEAEVDMSVKAVLEDSRGQLANQPVLRRVILRFRKADDGNWYVSDYNHMPITGGPDMFSPRR